jgi:hypothetical protein
LVGAVHSLITTSARFVGRYGLQRYRRVTQDAWYRMLYYTWKDWEVVRVVEDNIE